MFPVVEKDPILSQNPTSSSFSHSLHAALPSLWQLNAEAACRLVKKVLGDPQCEVGTAPVSHLWTPTAYFEKRPTVTKHLSVCPEMSGAVKEELKRFLKVAGGPRTDPVWCHTHSWLSSRKEKWHPALQSVFWEKKKSVTNMIRLRKHTRHPFIRSSAHPSLHPSSLHPFICSSAHHPSIHHLPFITLHL